ncbi:unnamed protein product, partial [marine sediment metagenome]
CLFFGVTYISKSRLGLNMDKHMCIDCGVEWIDDGEMVYFCYKCAEEWN